MIAYKCDVCKEDAGARKTAIVDGREYDLCERCYSKTVGKLKDGRPVWTWTWTPQPVYYCPLYVPNPQPMLPSYWQIGPLTDITYTYTNAACGAQTTQYLLSENTAGANPC